MNFPGVRKENKSDWFWVKNSFLQANYKEELEAMVQSGRKAEIEALYYHGYDFLGKYLANKVVQVDYI